MADESVEKKPQVNDENKSSAQSKKSEAKPLPVYDYGPFTNRGDSNFRSTNRSFYDTYGYWPDGRR